MRATSPVPGVRGGSPAERTMTTRRTFLALAAASAGALAACARGPRRSEPRAGAAPEELAGLLASTPRERVLGLVAERIEGGLEPLELVAAIHLAATRTVSTREEFGASQHSLLMMPSILRASRIVAPRDAWRPLLWWLDFYKWGQADLPPGARPMQPAGELAPVPAHRAAAELRSALEEHDGERAERAALALHRAGPRCEVALTLLLLASKDLDQLGHKAIHAASGVRLLEATGWRHGEEVLRSIALTLALRDEDEPRHASTWAGNRRRLRRLPPGWPGGGPGGDRARDDEAVRALLAAFRSASPEEACEEAVGWVGRGASSQALWDATFLGGAELMFQHPAGIAALHALTASNAAAFACSILRRPEDRWLVLLQNVGRVTDLRRYVESFQDAPDPDALPIDALEASGTGGGEGFLDALFDDVGGDAEARLRAARGTLGFLRAGGAPSSLERRATELVVATAADSHDYKVCAAAFEDHARVSERWRGHYLAACTSRFRGTSAPPAKLGALG